MSHSWKNSFALIFETHTFGSSIREKSHHGFQVSVHRGRRRSCSFSFGGSTHPLFGDHIFLTSYYVFFLFCVLQKLVTGPYRPRREAGVQSTELQG